MKYQLIVSSDDPADIMRLLSSVSGATLAAIGGLSPSPVASQEPDEGQPVAYVPGEVDANGVPWDERIHTSTHAKNADNTWRRKRNVDDATFAALTAELKARGMTVQTPLAPVASPAAYVPPAAPAAAPVPFAAPVAAAPVAMPVAAPAPAPAPAAAPVAAAPVAAPAGVDFPTLMQIVGNGVQTGKINQEYLTWLGATYGFGANIGTVAGNAELIGRIHAQLQVDGRL